MYVFVCFIFGRAAVVPCQFAKVISKLKNEAEKIDGAACFSHHQLTTAISGLFVMCVCVWGVKTVNVRTMNVATKKQKKNLIILLVFSVHIFAFIEKQRCSFGVTGPNQAIILLCEQYIQMKKQICEGNKKKIGENR